MLAHHRKQSKSHSSPFTQTLLWEFTECVHGRETQVVSLKDFFQAQCSWPVSPPTSQPPYHWDNIIAQNNFQQCFGLQIVAGLWGTIWNLSFVAIERNRRRSRSVNTTSSVQRWKYYFGNIQADFFPLSDAQYWFCFDLSSTFNYATVL